QLRSELRQKFVEKKHMPEMKEDKQPSDDASAYPSQVKSPRHEVREGSVRSPEAAATETPKKRETRRQQSKPIDKTEPRTADNWYEFAKLYQNQDKYPDALRALQKTLELDPGKVDAQLRIGEVYIKQEKFTDAITWLNQVIAKNVDNAHAWYLLGVAHLELGKYWDASKALYESVKIDDGYIDAWAQLGISLAKQDRHVQAQKAFLRALKHKRKDPDLLYQFALSLRKEGNLSRAENVLRMAIGYRKDFAEAWNELGEILILLGKLDEGGRAKRKARSFKQV
ncbi:MAG: tetratricopeptide repeat protein, partial [Candidatus Thorarchaeota archaeon]|nr:tetratricopeptide repeat protein [Candidatus Thorarchaeota archaeon]